MFSHAIEGQKEHQCPICKGRLHVIEAPYLSSEDTIAFRARCSKCFKSVIEYYDIAFKGIYYSERS